MQLSLTFPSNNKKTGPIATSMSSRETCPASCPLAKNGCYADTYHTRLWWDRVTDRKHGTDLAGFLQGLRKLPTWAMFRHNVAGDLPADASGAIDQDVVTAIARAVKHIRAAWTYTHRIVDERNKQVIASVQGFTINCSTSSRSEAARLQKEGVPSVCVVPRGTARTFTYEDVRFVQCPATLPGSTVQCSNCGGANALPLCAQRHRNFVVTFPAHGVKAAAAELTCS